MAKLYAEMQSDKSGRTASKSGDSHIRIMLYRGNALLGIVGLYEVPAGDTTPAGYRLVWSAEGVPWPQCTQTLADSTDTAHSTAH